MMNDELDDAQRTSPPTMPGRTDIPRTEPNPGDSTRSTKGREEESESDEESTSGVRKDVDEESDESSADKLGEKRSNSGDAGNC
jgi:hypothetical protein